MGPSEEIYHRTLEIIQIAEEMGFQNTWLAEHYFSNYGYSSRPLPMVVHLAAKTQCVRGGTAVTILPFLHLLMLAEEIDTADLLTRGRLDVGQGRGYQPYEFELLGLAIEEGLERWKEQINIIEQAIKVDNFSYQSRFYDIPETTILPKPVQKTMPLFFVAGQGAESIYAAVQRGFDVVTGGAGISFERLRESRRVFDKGMEKYRPARAPCFGINLAVYVTEDKHDARYMALEPLWNMRVTFNLGKGLKRIEKGRVAR